MRVGVYGGSFDPPHMGHALVASWLHWTDLVDEVWLLPVASHAFGKGLTPFAKRVGLCRAMAKAVGPWVRVCEIEQRMPAPNYTLYTLRALQEEHPEYRFRFVMGADNLAVADRWHRWDDLKADFPPIVVGRQGSPAPEGTIDFPNVSSTEVRARLRRGQSVGHLVPRAVVARLDGLYPCLRPGPGGVSDAS